MIVKVIRYSEQYKSHEVEDENGLEFFLDFGINSFLGKSEFKRNSLIGNSYDVEIQLFLGIATSIKKLNGELTDG